MCEDMHPGCIHPDKEWFTSLDLSFYIINAGSCGFIVNRFHPLFCKGACILNNLFAYTTPMGLYGRVVGIARFTTQHTAWFEILDKSRIVDWPIFALGLLLCIEVIQVSVEFIKAMDSWKKFVAVA